MMWHTALLACQLGGQRELREECFTVTRQRIIVVTWHGLFAPAPDFDNAPQFRAGISSVLLAWTPLAMVVLASSV